MVFYSFLDCKLVGYKLYGYSSLFETFCDPPYPLDCAGIPPTTSSIPLIGAASKLNYNFLLFFNKNSQDFSPPRSSAPFSFPSSVNSFYAARQLLAMTIIGHDN